MALDLHRAPLPLPRRAVPQGVREMHGKGRGRVSGWNMLSFHIPGEFGGLTRSKLKKGIDPELEPSNRP